MALLLLTIITALSVAAPVPLVLLPNAKKLNALCLDGTAPGFYLDKGTEPENFVIFLQGGGWCYNEEDCLARSRTRLGSSNFWAKEQSLGGWMLSRDAINPFQSWTHVYIPYCDGASFSGNRETPITVNGTQLHFRGKEILRQLIGILKTNYGLDSAKKVLLSGCSAGGLATYINADFVSSLMPASVTVFKAAPISGYFLDVSNADGTAIYNDEMRNVYKMQNVSANEACVAANVGSENNCMFAEHTFPHIKTPIFIQNSAYDSWQLGNIFWTHISPSHDSCIRNISSCSIDEIQTLNEKWQVEFVRRIVQPDAFWSNSTGCFIHSIISHCLGDSNVEITLDNVSIPEAWGRWFFELTTTNRHIGCTLHESPPYSCM